jgi:hypothetical protein
MTPEYSTKLFQCGSRCLSHRAVSAIYQRLAKEVEAAIESALT